MAVDRDSIRSDSQHYFDNSKKKSDHTSKKSWWIIGIIIALVMNFIAFFIFHAFHLKQNTRKNFLKNMY